MTLEEMRKDTCYVPPDFHEALMIAAHGVKEEPPMKKKAASSILIMAFVLVLLAATAFAAYALIRSEQTVAVSQARRALETDYGLTPETMGLFMPVAEQTGDHWVVTFHGFGFYPPLIGDYVVYLSPNTQPETHWTHDDVDKALWQNGDLTAPVWGQEQLLKALRDKDAADAITISLFQQEQAQPSYMGPTMPDDLAKDEAIWNNQRIKHSEPTPEAMQQEDACALAKEAVADEFGFPVDLLEPVPETISFYTRQNENPIWGFQFFVTDDDILYDCGVMLDAYTGEILTIGLITGGGNG